MAEVLLGCGPDELAQHQVEVVWARDAVRGHRGGRRDLRELVPEGLVERYAKLSFRLAGLVIGRAPRDDHLHPGQVAGIELAQQLLAVRYQQRPGVDDEDLRSGSRIAGQQVFLMLAEIAHFRRVLKGPRQPRGLFSDRADGTWGVRLPLQGR